MIAEPSEQPDPPGQAERAIEARSIEARESAGPALEAVLACLRRCDTSCEPPIGVGSFDVLYASACEVVVWYSPARAEHRAGEVAIPTAWLAAAWEALARGEQLDEPALAVMGEGLAGGRWLMALLAQVSGVRVRDDPLVLMWTDQRHATADEPATVPTRRSKPRRKAAG